LEQAAQGATISSMPWAAANAMVRAGSASPRRWLVWCAAEAPQQFQSSISVRGSWSASANARIDMSNSAAVPSREQPG